MTGEEFTSFMSMSELDLYLEANKETIIQTPSRITLGDPVRLGQVKPDIGFREILKEVKKKNIHSNINTW